MAALSAILMPVFHASPSESRRAPDVGRDVDDQPRADPATIGFGAPVLQIWEPNWSALGKGRIWKLPIDINPTVSRLAKLFLGGVVVLDKQAFFIVDGSLTF